jgi:hypothetical protein
MRKIVVNAKILEEDPVLKVIVTVPKDMVRMRQMIV